VPQIMEVQARDTRRAHHVDPPRQFVETVPTQRTALDPGKEERVIVAIRVLAQMCFRDRDDARRESVASCRRP
jgi:hypothetical protein